MNVCVLTSLEPTNTLIAQCVSQCERLGGEVYVLINELPFRTDNDTLYISFLGDVIIPESLISEHMYNTHPGPPWYRGWGSRLRTIMDKQSIHASTLHKVALPVDSGDIYKTIEFNVYQSDSMDDIHRRAELASLSLVGWLIDHYLDKGKPVTKVAEWSGKFMYNREYQKLRKKYINKTVAPQPATSEFFSTPMS